MSDQTELTNTDECTLEEDGKRKTLATFHSYIDECNCKLKLEFSIPGVKKTDIHLRLLDDYFSLTAPRDDMEYTNSGNFCCPIVAKEAKASYNNGLLMVEAPFKDPLSEAFEVPVA